MRFLQNKASNATTWWEEMGRKQNFNKKGRTDCQTKQDEDNDEV